jgi:hypothetical protein
VKEMKGHTNNPNGRPKGSKNRVTKEIRAILKDFMAAELEKLPGYLESLPDEKRLDVIIKLLPYVLPKVESMPPHYDELFDYDCLKI